MRKLYLPINTLRKLYLPFDANDHISKALINDDWRLLVQTLKRRGNVLLSWDENCEIWINYVYEDLDLVTALFNVGSYALEGLFSVWIYEAEDSKEFWNSLDL